MMVSMPSVRSVAIWSRPMGPQPWTSTTELNLSSPVDLARSREWTTTAAGSTRMRWSRVMLETLKNVEPLRTTMYSPK